MRHKEVSHSPKVSSSVNSQIQSNSKFGITPGLQYKATGCGQWGPGFFGYCCCWRKKLQRRKEGNLDQALGFHWDWSYQYEIMDFSIETDKMSEREKQVEKSSRKFGSLGKRHTFVWQWCRDGDWYCGLNSDLLEKDYNDGLKDKGQDRSLLFYPGLTWVELSEPSSPFLFHIGEH